MRNIAVIDENFDTSLATGCDLLVQFGDSFFSSMVYDRARNLFIACKSRWFPEPLPYNSLAFQLRNLINSDLHLALPYRSVRFQFVSRQAVLIPAPLFRSDKQEEYFRFSTILHGDSEILHNRIPQADAVVVFAIPAEVNSLVRLTWPDVRLFHQWSPQVSMALSEAPENNSKTQVMASIFGGHADLTVVNGGRLLLQNSFVIGNQNDLVFFILYLYDQLNLSQEETPLLLSGFSGLFPELSDTVAGYIRNITIAGLPESFDYSPVFASIPAEWFTNLINLLRCA